MNRNCNDLDYKRKKRGLKSRVLLWEKIVLGETSLDVAGLLLTWLFALFLRHFLLFSITLVFSSCVYELEFVF